MSRFRDALVRDRRCLCGIGLEPRPRPGPEGRGPRPEGEAKQKEAADQGRGEGRRGSEAGGPEGHGPEAGGCRAGRARRRAGRSGRAVRRAVPADVQVGVLLHQQRLRPDQGSAQAAGPAGRDRGQGRGPTVRRGPAEDDARGLAARHGVSRSAPAHRGGAGQELDRPALARPAGAVQGRAGEAELPAASRCSSTTWSSSSTRTWC